MHNAKRFMWISKALHKVLDRLQPHFHIFPRAALPIGQRVKSSKGVTQNVGLHRNITPLMKRITAGNTDVENQLQALFSCKQQNELQRIALIRRMA
jgi:hypothetical protein